MSLLRCKNKLTFERSTTLDKKNYPLLNNRLIRGIPQWKKKEKQKFFMSASVYWTVFSRYGDENHNKSSVQTFYDLVLNMKNM